MDGQKSPYMAKVAKIALEPDNVNIAGYVAESGKVIDFVHPSELGAALGGLNISPEPTKECDLEVICRKVIQYSVKTSHSGFYNQLYHGVDEYGSAAGWLSDALNTNSHTFECAPVFIVVERAVLQYIRGKLGWGVNGDGIFAAGGSMSNMYGMMLARHKAFPDIKTKGIGCLTHPLVAFTSEESHYSIVKAANWMGLGTDNVVKVTTDMKGQMCPKALEAAVLRTKEEGKMPFFVNATSGSTVMGAFDNLEAIYNVTSKYQLWLHVDACWGGAVIFSEQHKSLMKGVAKADSVAWNPHKMLGAPLQCSPFLTRHNNLLAETNCANATYLFQQDKFYDVSYDTGDKSIQCGRKVDAFKLWFMLKARGERAVEAMVDNAFEKAAYLFEAVKKRDGFRPAFNHFSCTNVGFYYLPEKLRNAQCEDEDFERRLANVAPKIKELLVKEGSLMIGYQPLAHKGKVNFFRMVVHCQPAPTNEHMDFILDEIDRLGKYIDV